jgi:hypothetical protein
LARVKRWLLVALGLAALIVALAEWSGRRAEPAGPPLDAIDEPSRERLRDVLREPATP